MAKVDVLVFGDHITLKNKVNQIIDMGLNYKALSFSLGPSRCGVMIEYEGASPEELERQAAGKQAKSEPPTPPKVKTSGNVKGEKKGKAKGNIILPDDSTEDEPGKDE